MVASDNKKAIFGARMLRECKKVFLAGGISLHKMLGGKRNSAQCEINVQTTHSSVDRPEPSYTLSSDLSLIHI